MKEHCMIEGKRCSKCCEVLTINEKPHLRAWIAYVRRYGVDEKNPELSKVAGMIRKISKRRAKKVNPFLVKTVKNQQSYFTCKNLKDGICTDYENRPAMCSEYPIYSRDEPTWLKYIDEPANLIGLYREDCTYYDQSYFLQVTL